MYITDDHEEYLKILYAKYWTMEDFHHILKYYDRRDETIS